jgi:hypothetical protein
MVRRELQKNVWQLLATKMSAKDWYSVRSKPPSSWEEIVLLADEVITEHEIWLKWMTQGKD